MKDEQKEPEGVRVYKIEEDGVDVTIRIEKTKPAKTLKEELARVPEEARGLAISYFLGLAAGYGIELPTKENKENDQ